MRKKNHGFGAKYRFELVLIYSEKGRKIMGMTRNTYLISAEKLWVWCEVQIWICIKLYRIKKKNHGSEMKYTFDISKKSWVWCNICKGEGRKIVGLWRSTHLISYNSIKEISRKIMGLVRSTHLNLYWFIRD